MLFRFDLSRIDPSAVAQTGPGLPEIALTAIDLPRFPVLVSRHADRRRLGLPQLNLRRHALATTTSCA